MKPAPFAYHVPRTLTEACELLATHDNARALAGGQSLLPLLNFRAVTPDHLIDLNRIGELAYLRVNDATLEAGAMTREEWGQFHLRHAELHLSFARPKC